MQRFVLSSAAAIAAVAMLTAAAQAGEVTVKNVHICCPQCVKIIGTALGKVDGVSGASCDRDTGTVTLQAADDKAAAGAIAALAKEGFFGEAAHGDKKLAFPDSGAKQGDKADTITLAGVHLCCPQCVKGVAKALEGISGATTKCDTKEKTVTVTGSGLDVLEVVTALNKGGFHGTVKK
jgi:copper chaperone CopZ